MSQPPGWPPDEGPDGWASARRGSGAAPDPRHRRDPLRRVLATGIGRVLVAAVATVLVVSFASLYLALAASRAPQGHTSTLVPGQGMATPVPTPTDIPSGTLPPGTSDTGSADVTFVRQWTGYNVNLNSGYNYFIGATDGSGDIPATRYSISVTAGAPDDVLQPPGYGGGFPIAPWISGQGFVVPANCATDSGNQQLADQEARVAIDAKLTATVPTEQTGGFDETSSFDHSSILCIPGPGSLVTSNPAGQYALSESATYSVTRYDPHDVMAAALHAAEKSVPSGWVFYQAQVCSYQQAEGGVQSGPYAPFQPTATRAAINCPVYLAVAVYNWTPDRLYALAGHLAGRDVATAMSLLSNNEGISAITQQPQITLSGGTTLPHDPSRIHFHVVTKVVLGQLH